MSLFLRRSISESSEQLQRSPSLASIRENGSSDSWSTIENEEDQQDKRSAKSGELNISSVKLVGNKSLLLSVIRQIISELDCYELEIIKCVRQFVSQQKSSVEVFTLTVLLRMSSRPNILAKLEESFQYSS